MQLTPDKPIAGILAPLFALRSEDDLGIGDTQTLREFVDWAADSGFGLVQLLPINETGGDNSPYMAISSLALEPSTLRISPDSVPDLSPTAFEEITGAVHLKKLRSGSVNYSEVKRLKRALLASAFESFSEKHLAKNSARARMFRGFIKEQSAWIQGYAVFRVLMDIHGTERWDKWPAEHWTAASALEAVKKQKPAQRNEFEKGMQFYRYVQWIAFTQWNELKKYCETKKVALMGDVPFGVSYYSADVFSNPELFDLTWSGGAPPEVIFKSDPFTMKWGQNWGVPIYRWDMMRGNDFAWWRQRVQTVRSMFHLFRIDHVLGFYRIYSFPWRPEENGFYLPLNNEEAKAHTGGRLPGFLPQDDSSLEKKEANCRQGEEVLKKLSQCVGEHSLIGEDLGVVPDYVRPNLTSLGIAGFKIPMWEKQSDTRFVKATDYPRLSVTTYATHDHPPLKVLWGDLYDAITTQNDGQARWEMQCFAEFAGLQVPIPTPYTPEIHEGLIAALFRSNAWIPICMITDLLGSSERFNVPGAVSESNWSTRLGRTVRQWRRNKEICALMKRMQRLLQETGRQH